MLTENEIIKKTTKYLEDQGYQILQSLNTNEKGVDIVAEKNGTKIYVEAKGETSSKSNTARYGKPFSKNQVGTHIAVAILAAMKQKDKDKTCNVAIALPHNENHTGIINNIRNSLRKAEIIVYLVGKNDIIVI